MASRGTSFHRGGDLAMIALCPSSVVRGCHASCKGSVDEDSQSLVCDDWGDGDATHRQRTLNGWLPGRRETRNTERKDNSDLSNSKKFK